MITIATDEELAVRDFVTQQQFKMKVVLEADASGLGRALAAPDTIPYSMFLDRNGKIIAVERSAMTQSDFDDLIEKASI